MSNLLRPSVFREKIRQLISLQPIHCQTWVLVSGGGFDAPPSYAFSYSYVGAVADAGQLTYRDNRQFESGSVANKTYVVILPYEQGKPVPRKNDMLILYRMDGSIYARAWVVSAQSYDVGTVGVSDSGIYKHEVFVQLVYDQ